MKISFVGAGNLATRLALCLKQQDHIISQVYSRTEKSAKELASLVEAKWTINPAEFDNTVDLVLVAISDKVFDEVLSKFDFNDCLLAHTAGSMPMNCLEKYSSNIGVFYPLQTFSKQREVDFSVIPMCIESETDKNKDVLIELANSISNSVQEVSSEKRKRLHLSAVWVCNFVNHMYAIGDDLLAEIDLPFSMLHPLISETAAKSMEFAPTDVQTGPAVRFDANVINKHLQMLDEKKQVLYSEISKSIYQKHKQ